jgi:hypothetical protein
MLDKNCISEFQSNKTHEKVDVDLKVIAHNYAVENSNGHGENIPMLELAFLTGYFAGFKSNKL